MPATIEDWTRTGQAHLTVQGSVALRSPPPVGECWTGFSRSLRSAGRRSRPGWGI